MSTTASIDRLACDVDSDIDAIMYEDGASTDDVDAFAALLEEFALDEPCLGPLQLDPLRVRIVARRWALSLLANADLCIVARLRSSGSGTEDGAATSAQSPKPLTAPQSHRCRIVGVALNFHVEPGQPDDSDDEGWLGNLYPQRQLRDYERFLIALERRADVCASYGDGNGAAAGAMLVGVLACARDQRGHGIAGGLVRRSLELAERLGYRLATTTATSAYSQRAFERCGFKRVLEVSYAELPNASLYSDEHRRLHRSVVVYARRLLVDRRMVQGSDVAGGAAVTAELRAIAQDVTQEHVCGVKIAVSKGCGSGAK